MDFITHISPELREFGSDVIALVVSILLIANYYRKLAKRIRHDPHGTATQINQLARHHWTLKVMLNPGMEIVAVQTLRNFIMVGIMMASTASLLIMGTLTLSGQAANITRSWHVLGVMGSHAPELWIVKVICLLAAFLVAFFSYALSIRLANQVLFMINLPAEAWGEHGVLAPEVVAMRLNQAGHMVAIGMRAFFFAIPLVFWLFGPLFLVLATLGLIFILDHLDRPLSE